MAGSARAEIVLIDIVSDWVEVEGRDHLDIPRAGSLGGFAGNASASWETAPKAEAACTTLLGNAPRRSSGDRLCRSRTLRRDASGGSGFWKEHESVERRTAGVLFSTDPAIDTKSLMLIAHLAADSAHCVHPVLSSVPGNLFSPARVAHSARTRGKRQSVAGAASHAAEGGKAVETVWGET